VIAYHWLAALTQYMEPNTFDRHILDWCNQNGWDYPQKKNGMWYAIAPNTYLPQPIPAESSRQATLTFGIDISTAEAGFRQASNALNAIDWVNAFDSLNKVLAKVTEVLESTQKLSLQSSSSTDNAWIKLRDKRNQAMMRTFLRNRFPTSCNHKTR
jgi:hypothetical protein